MLGETEDGIGAFHEGKATGSADARQCWSREEVWRRFVTGTLRVVLRRTRTWGVF